MRNISKLIQCGVVVGALAAFSLASSPTTAFAAGAKKYTVKTDDASLDKRIEARMKKDPVLKKMDVDASVDHGVVTLTGKVRTDDQKARAERLAKVSGVTRVDDRLEVDPNAGKSRTQQATQKTKDIAKGAGEKTKEAVSKTGEVITDGWITARVKSRFIGEDALKGSDINVDTSNHVVTLKGTVASEAGRARAIAIANDTEGVRRVVDHLTIAPKK